MKQRKFRSRIIYCLLAVLTSGFTSTTVAQVRQVTINPVETFQTIDNFTASDAWSSNLVGKYWGEQEKEQIAEWLFSREYDKAGNPKGIGLSLWRVYLGAGTWEQDNPDIMPWHRRAESFLTVDGKNYDWGKCAGQRYFMKKAKEHGCNNFLLFSNSPPVQYTLNGRGYASNTYSANIKPDCYDKFADYLAEVATHFMGEGFHVSYVSPINEPQVEWNTPRQEGSSWKKSEMKKMYVSLDKALSVRPSLSSVKIMVGECSDIPVLFQENANLAKRFEGNEEAPHKIIQAFFDKQSPHYIGDLKHVPQMAGGHTYHNHTKNKDMLEVRAKVKDECEKYGIAYQQTEWCLLPDYSLPMDGFTDDWQKGTRTDIQVGLLMGRLIYTDLVHSGAEAWGYWKCTELKGEHSLIGLHVTDGNIFNGGTVSTNKLLWALGNYSLFIQPGYKRICSEGANDLDKLVSSAYIAPDQSRIVIVFVNSGFENEQVAIQLPKAYSRKVKRTTVYRTDKRSDLTNVSVSDKLNDDYLIYSRSLTTVVLDF